jgi:hypothetical protein
MIERKSHTTPGYNCKVECPHEPKGDHGRHCDNWYYVVSEGKWVVVLTVFSGIYPDSVDTSRMDPEQLVPTGAYLTFHWAAADGEPCELVPGGLCKSDGTCLGATKFFEEYGDKTQFTQPETFWKALEERLKRQMEWNDAKQDT